MSFIDSDARTVEYGRQAVRLFESGEGPPVVVMHGWGGRIESMVPVLSCLSPDHRVVALDLPGFGSSPLPDGVWGTPDYAAFVRDLLASLGIAQAHFIGHSFGAKVALYLAATHPGLVDKLVLVGSPGLRLPPSLQARAKRLLSKGGRAVGALGAPGRKLRDGLYSRIASEDYKHAGPLRPILVKVVNEDLSSMLGRVASPTLLVWGTEDDAVPLSHAKRMEALIPDAGLVSFEGAGHFAYLDEPERFCRVVRSFFGASGG
jgi:pimeloyl-ACP methyl ester carboxylesterase